MSEAKKQLSPAQSELLNKIKQAGIVGRGGGGFPTHLKWERIAKFQGSTASTPTNETHQSSQAANQQSQHDQQAQQNQQKKYVVCNVSEGEPGVKKDFYLLKHKPRTVLEGFRLALDFVGSDTGYFNFNADYWQKLQAELTPLLERYREEGYQLIVFEEEPSYIGGETGSLLNAIEGRRVEPRLRPPSPSLAGIHGVPVLLHNVETLHDVYLAANDEFDQQRYYTIGGQAAQPGVYRHPSDWPAAQVLRATDNYPDFEFFAQVGGGASGPIWNQKQLENKVTPGCGSIEIYPATTQPMSMLKQWFQFYAQESCGKCAPCRQGTYHLWQLVKNLDPEQTPPWSQIMPIIDSLETTAFCDLGGSLPIPIKTYRQNVLGLAS